MDSGIYQYLMDHRDAQEDVYEAHIFAQCISHNARCDNESLSAAMGLSQTKFRMLINRYFARVLDDKPIDRCIKEHLNLCTGLDYSCQCENLASDTPSSRVRDEEMNDLKLLLLDHSSSYGEHVDWITSMIAAACLRDNHLWQDLGLACREELNQLLSRYFPILYNKNTGNMKWKKFLYKQLCELGEVSVCLAPSCAVCIEYAACFGPEDATDWSQPTVTAAMH
ncbi:hypothetical protein A9404_01575 [Halothiobacillus diazotrophicus]|uniref:Nitrogen fixation protein NifQ n=1 Tax=Halothiobacillus diazotrophicus TaxID=1860122 RepID=A0A191ZEE3_9GAMM|nr:nitrogen fixation protein NifQ [Halothiobacillus diazotrophicus]ANJ66237.1 hypothetical protein A9404_01575 [Halothiobacillus diazotrophicus]